MNAPRHVLAPAAALRRLADFPHESGSSTPPAEAATIAINEWIAAAQGKFTHLAPTPTRGYQWKSLFLPDGTELRMRFGRLSLYARVSGDAIWYQGSACRRARYRSPLRARPQCVACAVDSVADRHPLAARFAAAARSRQGPPGRTDCALD
jgi:hypothetical protein